MLTPTRILDIATRATQKQLGSLTKAAFFFGDGLQRAAVDELFTLLTPRTWSPPHVVKMIEDTATQSVHLLRFLVPGETGRLTWKEVRNKLEVFVLVQDLPDILGLRSGEFLPISALVDKAYSLPGFEALWAIEGVGHYYADSHWERNGAPASLLSAGDSEKVPASSLLMLHAGMGLCFADRLLGDLASKPSASSVRAAVQAFVSLCRGNSRPGYLGATVESMGLVARDFYPEVVSAIDGQIQEIAPELLGFFWHGVGRALYFSRAYFLPILRTPWSSIDREVSHEAGRINAMAGLAWAFTLVNMRQPQIMENLLRMPMEWWPFDGCARGNAFANGVISSIIMRTETTPDEAFVADFYEHHPDAGDIAANALWNRYISGPARAALQNDYPALKRQGRLDEIFRYGTVSTPAEDRENKGSLRRFV